MRKLFGLAMLALVGCGVPQAEYDEVVKERDGLKEEVAKLKGELATAKKARVTDRSRRPTPKAPPADKVDQWLKEADITRESKLQAVFDTNHGKITCDLVADKAPLTVANFVGLAEGNKEWTDPKSKEKVKKPFYNGLVFHRIIKNFMIQGGDPMGSGRGGPGYRFEDEVDNGLKFDKPGLLAMANAGPGTNGSQFFITDSTPAHLNGKHTIFGTCDMPTVKKIINVPVNRSKPVEPVVMNTVSIVRN